MAKSVRVTNQTKNDILTITGGWLRAHETAVVEDWEASLLSDLYGTGKVFVIEEVAKEPKETKKKKK